MPSELRDLSKRSPLLWKLTVQPLRRFNVVTKARNKILTTGLWPEKTASREKSQFFTQGRNEKIHKSWLKTHPKNPSKANRTLGQAFAYNNALDGITVY